MNKRMKALVASAGLLASVAAYEGYRGEAYDDGTGVWTLGFGTTRNIKPGMTTSPERALEWMASDIDDIQTHMRTCLGPVPLHQYEWDAYVSLTYNIGSGAFCRSTLVKMLKSDPPDYDGACKQILRWVHAGGKRMRGLVIRREGEYLKCTGQSE